MTKRIPYWLYKTGYTNFPASEYDSASKTIAVDLPEYKKPRFPKSWKKFGNHYYAPNGCVVTFWGSGLSENFHVEKFVTQFYQPSMTVPASLDAREKVMEFVARFD